MPISDAIKLAQFDAIFVEMVGGPKIVEMLAQYHLDGETYERLSEMHQLPLMTVHYKLGQARERMRRCHVWPEGWNERCRKSSSRSPCAIPMSLSNS